MSDPTAPLTRLMIVEDDPDIQKIAKLVLESIGKLTVQSCSSGAEMLREAPGFRPQLILMDMMMPGMDGLAALAALKSTPEIADIPVIFMTAKVQALEIKNYKKMGARGVIRKPFEPMALPQLVQDLWKNRPPA